MAGNVLLWKPICGCLGSGQRLNKGLKMISNRIDLYVEEAVQPLPRSMRTGARRRLKNLIYEMLEDYTEGDQPTRQDLWTVLEVLGEPAEVGRQMLDHYVREREVFIRKAKKLAMLTSRVLYILAFVLIAYGIASLASGPAANAVPLGLAAICGAAALGLQVFFPGFFDKNYPAATHTRGGHLVPGGGPELKGGRSVIRKRKY